MINTIFNILLFIPTPIRGKVAQKSEIQTHMCTTHIFNNTPFFGVRAPPGTYFYPQKNRAKNNFHRKNGVLLVPHFFNNTPFFGTRAPPGPEPARPFLLIRAQRCSEVAAPITCDLCTGPFEGLDSSCELGGLDEEE